MTGTRLINVNLENLNENGFFCIKNQKRPEFELKRKWFEKSNSEGLRIKILHNHTGKQIGYIEYVPAQKAWRPVKADDFMFIQCLFIYGKKEKNIGNGSLLVKECEKEAKRKGMKGVCTLTSNGTFMADKRLFLKNGYTEIASLEHFELLVKKYDEAAKNPELIDWTKTRDQYVGWHLIYADQCPWHDKSVNDLKPIALENGIDLHVKRITSSREAKQAPSGYGVYSLIHDGKLLADHYISGTRFKNILMKESIK